MGYRPLVIVALDAADANLLNQWREEGYLPALSSMMNQGMWGQISGEEYFTPHGLWLSLFSGVNKAEHGFYYYRQLKPSSYTTEPYDVKDASAIPFWSRANSEGARVAILDVPETYPISGLTGCQLANFRIHNSPGDPVSEPSGFLKTAIEFAGERQVVSERANSTLDQDREIYNHLIERIRGNGRLGVEILRREKPDCTVIGFSETHIAGHQLWKYRESDTEMRDAIRNVYQEIDRQLELILQACPDANVYVVSNTGIQDQTPTAGLLRSFCESLGYQVRTSKKTNSASVIRFLRKLIPQDLQAYAMYKLSASLRQKMLSEIFPIHSDWSRTRAFVLPTSYTGMIRINLKGREPLGIVEPGAEYRNLLDQIESDLKQLIDPKTQESVVEVIHRPAQIYHSDPPAVLPDLVVKWKPTKAFQEEVVHPKAILCQNKPKFYRQNNHTEYGFFAGCGSSLKQKGKTDGSTLTGFAPVFLSLLGIDSNGDRNRFDG